MCNGFFSDPRHLAKHFEYVTESPALDRNVEKYLRQFLNHLELYLLNVDKSVGFKKSLADIQMVCEEELNGSTMLRDVHLLVGRPIDILVNIYLLRERLPNISTKVVLLNCSG